MDSLVRYVPGRTAVVLDSPHSGVDYPEDFLPACDMAALRSAEDTHVEKLYDFAPALGVAWIEALFPRSYLDPNRGLEEMDVTLFGEPWPGKVEQDPARLNKVRLGKGVIWRCTDEGVDIYDRKLSVAEAQARIERCWKPFHEAVRSAIDDAHARHGYSIHIDCHSMPAVSAAFSTDYPGLVHADFVIGDRDGTTAAPGLSRRVCAFLEGRGYSVSYNHPYKGVELVRRYSDPVAQRHSIQVEVNRRLYMDEATFDMTPAAARLRTDLEAFVRMLVDTDPRAL